MKNIFNSIAMVAVLALGYVAVPSEVFAGRSPVTRCSSCGAWNGGVTGTSRCADCEAKNSKTTTTSTGGTKKSVKANTGRK